jgi:hypothetical protein
MKIQQLKESDLLYQDIEKRIDSIKQKKNLYLSLFRTTKIIVFIAGATITILTGWEITSETKSKFNPDNYILVISACITLLAAIEGLFNFRDKGKSYDVLLFELRRLRDQICFDYIVSAYSYEKNKKIHFDKFQSILESQKSIIENSEGEDE